jgi:peroxiredoxin
MAPDFELDGSQGRSVRLSSLRGDWIALVFADRLETLPELTRIQSDLRKVGVRVVGVCREKASRVQTSYTRGLPILILADATGEVGSLYGLRPVANSITRPAFLLLNRRGVVKLTVTGQELTAEQIRDLATAKVRS